MAVVTHDIDIRFLGFAEGAEIVGAVQADFAVDPATGHTKELSVLLNGPAAARLAEVLGTEPNTAFHQLAARATGIAWVKKCLVERRHLDSITVVSKSLLEQHPGLIDGIRGELALLPAA